MPDIPDLTAYIMTGTKYLLPILALWILLRCIRSMLREKYEPETWAWLLDEDGAALPVSHWESIIGRSPSSDIVIDMPSVSKLHASLQRDGDGDWTLSDLRSREGTYINGDEIDILEPVEDGDTVEFGDAVMTFREIDAAERAALERRRTAPGRFVGPGVTLLILSLFQAFLTLEFTITAAQEYLFPICLAFFALMVTEWFCYLVTRSVRRTGFEPETLAFFLTTLGTAVCATATPEDMFRQTIFIILGVALYFFLGAWLRSLERVKSSRFIAAAAALGLLAVNVVFSEAVFGAKNLKAMSFIGSKSIPIADPAALVRLRLEVQEKFGYDIDAGKVPGAPGSPGAASTVLDTSPTVSRAEGCRGCFKNCRNLYPGGVGNELTCSAGLYFTDSGKIDEQLAAYSLLSKLGLNGYEIDMPVYLHNLYKRGVMGKGKDIDTDLPFEQYARTHS